MPEDTAPPDPPQDMPEDLAETLRAHGDDVHALREAIIYAQELLNAHQASALPIEPQAGEEFVRVTEHEGYTEVVKRLPNDDVPYLYHVEREPHTDGEDHLHWTLVGRADHDAG